MDNKDSYRSLFKATSLFGGVQVYQIAIGILKSKLVAMLLGPNGIGIQGLFTSATELIKQLSSFGLSQSAVRDISEAKASGDINRVNKTVSVLRKLVVITGSIGLIATVLLSPILSMSSFGNTTYTLGFILLAVTLLFDQISAGQKVELQGMRRLKDLAKASAIGSTFGLFLSVPLFYFWGTRGIVPALILNSLCILFITFFYSRKINDITIVKCSLKSALSEGGSMIKMGIALSISSILVSLCSYVLRGYIRGIGGVESVGCFTAGYMIINTYVAMVFNAMATDYYPRLAAVNKDNDRCRELVNQQSEIGILILTPLLSICLLFTPLLIKILYADSFLPAAGYVSWASLGMTLKLTAWCISYQFIAKGESRIFVFNEITQNTYMILLNILGYRLGGLEGLGVAFVLSQFIYFIQVYTIARRKYSFSFSREYVKLFAGCSCALVVIFLSTLLSNRFFTYVIGISLLIIVTVISYIELDKRINLSGLLKKTLKK